jgi:methionine aminopeptidase
VQRKLMELARVELDDAVEVLSAPADPIYPVALDRLALARDEIARGIAAATSGQRLNRLSNAIARVINARDQVGDNVTFQLGQGNLMF